MKPNCDIGIENKLGFTSKNGINYKNTLPNVHFDTTFVMYTRFYEE